MFMRKKAEMLDYLERVIASGKKIVSIAEESGVPDGSLRQFRASGALGPEYRAKLDRWISLTPMPEATRDVCDEVAMLLDQISRFMRNPRVSLYNRVAYLEANLPILTGLLPELQQEARTADGNGD